MDNNMNNYENNGYQPPVDNSGYQQPQYNAPQQNYQPPQYNAPQYNAPQYNAPQQNYQPPQYGAPQQNYQQQQYGTPQYGQPMYAPLAPKDESKGMAIASLVCGILSLTCCCGSFIPSILAVVFGIISKSRKSENNGMALAGIILGAIGVIFSIIYIIFLASGGFEDLMNELYYY